MPDTLQFVDMITGSPNVRLDLNDESPWALKYEGTDFSPPRLRRATAETLMADGAQTPAAAYDDRIVRLRLELIDSTVDAAALAIQELARELDRPFNLLRWQPGTTHPVFFRTKRSDVNRIVEVPGPGTLKLIDVEVLAEPFAYGLSETLSGVNVNNDPAGAVPMFWEVSTVKGDVDAATKLVTDGDPFASIAVVATRRASSTSNVPFLVQAEAMTQGTDTTTQANDAAMSGAGNNYSRCTFATASMQTRLTTAVPAVTSANARGLYRVYTRVRHSVSGDNILLRLEAEPGNGAVGAITIGERTLNSGTGNQWYDLGLLQIPLGPAPLHDGPSNDRLNADSNCVILRLRAQRVSGTGNMDVDFIILVPADDQFATIDFGNESLGTGYVLDSFQDAVYGLVSTAVDSSKDIVALGTLPTLKPVIVNRIYFILLTPAISTVTTVTVTYWPRYVYVRPASS